MGTQAVKRKKPAAILMEGGEEQGGLGATSQITRNPQGRSAVTVKHFNGCRPQQGSTASNTVQGVTSGLGGLPKQNPKQQRDVVHK